MKVAVFGASGKVGTLIVERVLHAGHEVTKDGCREYGSL